MKQFLLGVFFLFSTQISAQSYFTQMCNTYIEDKSSTDNDLYRIQFSWLKKRFRTSDCKQIASEITSLSSFNKIIPYHQHGLNEVENEVLPFKPITFQKEMYHQLATEAEWNKYRDAFKHLKLFSEFKNLTHITHDPTGIEEYHNFCQTLDDLPSIKEVTIRHPAPPNSLRLKDEEVKCLVHKNLELYITGDFIPDGVSEIFKKNIVGIENFLGDIKTLQLYRKLNYLGLLKYNGESNLKVLTGIKSLKRLSLNLENINEPEDVRHLTYLNYLSMNCIESEVHNNHCANRSLKSLEFIRALKSLKGLDISWNRIHDISPLSNLKKLRYLSIKNNQVRLIRPIETLTQLKYIDLSFNNISSIDSIKSLKEVRLLNISNNEISDFSPLSSLPKLTYLSAGRNPYSLDGFSPTKELRVLNLNGLEYYNSPDNLKDLIRPSFELPDEQGWTNLTLFETKRIRNNFIMVESNDSILTFDMEKLKNLEFLSIRDNSLTATPSITGLNKLKYLDISFNMIKDTVFLSKSSSSIEFLIASSNLFTDIPSLKNFSQLKFLQLNMNDLKYANLDIRSNKLTDLILTQCNLSTLPDLSKSPNIERLALGHNSLKTFYSPSLKILKQLLLEGNLLGIIPDLKEHLALYYVSLRDNQITTFENLDTISVLNQPPRTSGHLLNIRIDLSQNMISDLAFFNDRTFNYFDLTLSNNPIDRDSTAFCPKDSPNKSVAYFCSST